MGSSRVGRATGGGAGGDGRGACGFVMGRDGGRVIGATAAAAMIVRGASSDAGAMGAGATGVGGGCGGAVRSVGNDDNIGVDSITVGGAAREGRAPAGRITVGGAYCDGS